MNVNQEMLDATKRQGSTDEPALYSFGTSVGDTSQYKMQSRMRQGKVVKEKNYGKSRTEPTGNERMLWLASVRP